MADNDPLAKAEALLARYRTGTEPTQVHADFPVLTEIVEAPPQSSGSNLVDLQDISSPEQISSAKLGSSECPTDFIRSVEGRLGADFRQKLAIDLAKRIEPVIGAFASQLAERMASEITSSVSQEISRLLSEALADQEKARLRNDRDTLAP